jgi:hypothetical protein
MIERLINERLQKRLFKSWWETAEFDYFMALDFLRELPLRLTVQEGQERLARITK